MPVAKSGGTFTPAPEGSHVARCFAVISLGTQHSLQFADSFKVQVSWELPGETIEIDGKAAPMVISKEYTLSLAEKSNLRRDLVSWRGKQFTPEELGGFVVEKVIGAPCILNIVHKTSGKGKTYATVASVSPLIKGMVCPDQFHKSQHYEIEMGENEMFKALPKFVQTKIMASEEMQMAARRDNPADTEEPPIDDGTQNEGDDGENVPF